MSLLNTKNWCAVSRFLSVVAAAAVVLLLAASAQAAAPGITGTAFSLNAGETWSSQPDGVLVYSWGYGCAAGFTPTFAPATVVGPFCPSVQLPGPTLIVTENTSFTVTLTNSLPAAAGNTSILFPGASSVVPTGGTAGLLTAEATPAGGTVTYSVTYSHPGTFEYYSGT
jgi:FtsP/CotA-like multicopper oxidase with cupredoxin domain